MAKNEVLDPATANTPALPVNGTAPLQDEPQHFKTTTPTDSGMSQEDADDLAALRLPLDFHSGISGQPVITVVPIRKPGRQDWVRVRPGEDWYLDCMVLEIKEDRENYFLMGDVAKELFYAGHGVPKRLHVAITRSTRNSLFLWPRSLEDGSGKINSWTSSTKVAIEMAESSWVQVVPNMAVGGYEVSVAEGIISDPVWPPLSMAEIFRIASRGRRLAVHTEPVLQRLLGKF